MKIKTTPKKHWRNVISSTIALVLLILLALLCLRHFSQHGPAHDQQSTDGKPRQQSLNNSQKDNSPTETETKPITKQVEKDMTTSGSGSISASISHKSIVSDVLILRITIDQFLSSGQCHLIMYNNQKTIERVVNIAQNPSSSSCMGFDIPINEIGNGNWSITINISSNDKKGSVADNITIG